MEYELPTIIQAFNREWYAAAESHAMPFTWRGITTLKCPMDLMVYAELIHRVGPEIIVETGTCYGGSALFLRDMQRFVRPNGCVVTVDNGAQPGRPEADGLRYIHGSSTDPAVISQLERNYFDRGGSVMVILDSDHHEEHVRRELAIYSKYVTRGSYLIVEDTNINGHPVHPRDPQAQHPGPFEAVEAFMRAPEYGVWEQHRACERFLVTWNPGGYLRRLG